MKVSRNLRNVSPLQDLLKNVAIAFDKDGYMHTRNTRQNTYGIGKMATKIKRSMLPSTLILKFRWCAGNAQKVQPIGKTSVKTPSKLLSTGFITRFPCRNGKQQTRFHWIVADTIAIRYNRTETQQRTRFWRNLSKFKIFRYKRKRSHTVIIIMHQIKWPIHMHDTSDMDL